MRFRSKEFELGWLAALHGDTREWAVEHGGEEAGAGYDAYWEENSP